MSTTLRKFAFTEIREILPNQMNIFYPEMTASKVLGTLERTRAYEAVVASEGTYGIISLRDLLNVEQPTQTKIDDLWRPTGKISLENTIITFCEVLVRNNLRAMPVVENGEIVGIVSQIDVVSHMHKVSELADYPAKQYVRSPVLSLDLNEGIGRARRIMLEKGISHIPIVEYGRLVGMVTAEEIIHTFITPTMKITTGDRIGRRTSRVPGKVHSIMDPRPCTISMDASILDAATRQRDHEKSACIMIDNSSRILGILTPREMMAPILQIRAERELPIYIIGIEDEDFVERAIVEEKLRRVVERVGKYKSDITEVSVRIKKAQTKGERTRYDVTGRAITPEGQINAEVQGWDLLAVFDEFTAALEKAIKRRKPRTLGRTRRRRSRR